MDGIERTPRQAAASVGRRAVVVLTILLLGVMSCRTWRQAEPGPASTARILALRVPDARVDYATLEFDVEFVNASEAELSVKALRYGLASGPNMFLSATPVRETTVPGYATTVLPLKDTVVYERILRALNAHPGSTIPFSLELRLSVESAAGGPLQLTLKHAGQLLLPLTSSDDAGGDGTRTLDVIYIATPQDVVDKMLSMAEVREKDLLYDLGCGDGRIAITGAKTYGCRSVGYDIDLRRVQESRRNVERTHLESLVRIEEKDIFAVDLRPADVVAFYLNPVVNRRLIPQLRTLKPGARIVSHSFPIGNIEPDQIVTMTSEVDGKEHRIYLWTAPLKVN
jgi:hypothetical protein